MSYCRWSTNDFQCDLYCYYSVGDFFATHVAANRIHWKVPLPPREPYHFKNGKLNRSALKRNIRRDVEMMRLLDIEDGVKWERKEIGLPYDGETFEDAELDDFLRTLEMLKEAGYVFPDHVFDAVKEEIQEQA